MVTVGEFMLYTIPLVEGLIITEHKLPWSTFFERMLYLFLYLTATFIIDQILRSGFLLHSLMSSDV